MSSRYNEETAWIKALAENLSHTYDVSYSLVLYAGQEAYRQGAENARVREVMVDYCRTKAGHIKRRESGVQSAGTG